MIKKYKRCWNNHIMEIKGKKIPKDCTTCKAPLMETMYDTNDVGLAYKAGGGWGNAIKIHWPKEAFDGEKTVLRGEGWKQRIPHEGDYILQEMESGRFIVVRIIKVEKCGNPPDMFFFDAKAMDYLDNMPDFTPKYEEDIRRQYEIGF